MDDMYMGSVEDTYGRDVKVYRDRSGAVRLVMGLTDLMLPEEQWTDLCGLGNRALEMPGAGA